MDTSQKTIFDEKQELPSDVDIGNRLVNEVSSSTPDDLDDKGVSVKPDSSLSVEQNSFNHLSEITQNNEAQPEETNGGLKVNINVGLPNGHTSIYTPDSQNNNKEMANPGKNEIMSNLHDDLQLSSDSSDSESADEGTEKTASGIDTMNHEDLASQYTTINDEANLPQHIINARQIKGFKNDHTYCATCKSLDFFIVTTDFHSSHPINY